MRVDIVFPVLPPALDGIGDHTAQIARRMAGSADVRVLTAQADATPIPGVDIQPVFSVNPPWGVRSLFDAVAARPPDWLIVQFNQFSYGRWGLNPFLPRTLRRIRQQHPDVRIAWMAHEDFVPATSLKFRIMRQWQQRQFRALGQLADHVFFSIDPWVKKYASWFPETPVDHFPIGSNMPRVNEDPQRLRREYDIDEAFVVGFFGTLRARHLGHIIAALKAIHDATPQEVVLLSVGPDGDALTGALTAALPSLRMIDAGRLPALDVSRHLAAMDLQLAPFTDGVSTRRGSFMAGLQHGVPTVATDGELTDHVLREAHGEALILTPVDDTSAFAQAAADLSVDTDRRVAIGRCGQHLYDTTFDFDVTVSDFLNCLSCRPASFSDADASTSHERNSVYAHR